MLWHGGEGRFSHYHLVGLFLSAIPRGGNFELFILRTSPRTSTLNPRTVPFIPPGTLSSGGARKYFQSHFARLRLHIFPAH